MTTTCEYPQIGALDLLTAEDARAAFRFWHDPCHSDPERLIQVIDLLGSNNDAQYYITKAEALLELLLLYPTNNSMNLDTAKHFITEAIVLLEKATNNSGTHVKSGDALRAMALKNIAPLYELFHLNGNQDAAYIAHITRTARTNMLSLITLLNIEYNTTVATYDAMHTIHPHTVASNEDSLITYDSSIPDTDIDAITPLDVKQLQEEQIKKRLLDNAEEIRGLINEMSIMAALLQPELILNLKIIPLLTPRYQDAPVTYGQKQYGIQVAPYPTDIMLVGATTRAIVRRIQVKTARIKEAPDDTSITYISTNAVSQLLMKLEGDTSKLFVLRERIGDKMQCNGKERDVHRIVYTILLKELSLVDKTEI